MLPGLFYCTLSHSHQAQNETGRAVSDAAQKREKGVVEVFHAPTGPKA